MLLLIYSHLLDSTFTVKPPLLYFLEVIANISVQTEVFTEGCRKAMPSLFYLVLSPMSCCMVHEFLYAASLPDQPEVRVTS